MRSSSTKIFNLSEKPYDIAGVTQYAKSLRKTYSSKPKTTMAERSSPSKIMLPVIKKAGLF